jgi:small subunit ribosomal protein S1
MNAFPNQPLESPGEVPPPADAIAAQTPAEAAPEAGATIPSGTTDPPPAPAGTPASGEVSSAGSEPGPSLQPGSIRHGKVVEVTADQVVLDLGNGIGGHVAFIEFAGHPTPKPGDEVSVIVEKYDPATKELGLSKRHADEVLFWQTVRPGDLLEGVVTGMNKGGLDIDIGGARAFLPTSQVDVRRMKDISVLIGEHVQCVVTQVDRTTKDLVVSRRKAIERQHKKERQTILDTLTEGDLRQGRITNLTEYGAFVNLGGADGLIHITDLSWGRVVKPAEVVHPGQEVTVRILKVDRAKGKVSLGLKQATPDPWESVESRYPAGSRIRTQVARLADFGAFLELEKGVDALLPLSEMSWSRRIGKPEDMVQVGQEIEVQVLKVEPAKRRISVSLKQLQDDPWATIESHFPVDGKFNGKVTRIMEFGAFVELAPGIEGLIHISELAPRRINAVGDVVQEGQEVEVRVLKIDVGGQRISLSMRPPTVRRPAAAETEAPGRPANKNRKRPLRGGLASHFDW